jgi:hypothetical protein
VVWQSGMAAQAEHLQGCLARVGSFLEHAEAALSRISLLPAMLKTTPTSGPAEVSVGSPEDRGAELYGSFYPRVGDKSLLLSSLPCDPSSSESEPIVAVVALVLQTMPELQELCATPDLALSLEHVKVNAPVISSLPKCPDVESTPISPRPPPNPDALFAGEICDLRERS